MPLDFPSSPTVGQQYLNWTWNGVAWIVAPGPPLAPAQQANNNVGRNLADNALFNVQQRGAGLWTTNGYTADRWLALTSLDTMSFGLAAFSDAQRAQIGDEAAISALSNSFTGNAGAAAYDLVQQRIEKVRRLAGKTITVSFWAAATAAGLSLGVSVDQTFGTGGSPSAPVYGNGQAQGLSTTLSRYSATFNLPSSAGKTFGTNGDDFTSVNLWYSSGSTNAARAGIGVQSGTVILWGVQVEIGTQATPLEKLDPQRDLARCQRFFIGAQGSPISIAGYMPSGTANISAPVLFPVTMRATPTINLANTGSGNVSTLTVSGASPVGFSAAIAGPAAGYAYCTVSFSCTADL